MCWWPYHFQMFPVADVVGPPFTLTVFSKKTGCGEPWKE